MCTVNPARSPFTIGGRRVPRAAAAALALTVVLLLWPDEAAACSVAPPDYTFVGEALSIDGDKVTYRVESVDLQEDHGVRDPFPTPAPGDGVEIDYFADDARFINTAMSYRVNVWISEGTARSGVLTDEDICGGGGTRNADSSPIATGFHTRTGFEPWVAAAIGVPVGVGLVALVLLVRRNRARRDVPDESTSDTAAPRP